MRNLRIAAILAVGLAVISTLLSSCGFKDIDKRFFVVEVGIDQGKSKQWLVTLKLAIPSPNIRPGEEKFQMISKEADTISQAIRLLKSDVDKELDFGHAKMIVFGKAVVMESLSDLLDLFFRRRDMQQSSYVAIGDPTAAEVLKTRPPSERTPGNALLLSFGKEGTESSYVVTAYLFDLFRRLKETGKDPYLPIIKVKKDNFEINQVAVFDKQKLRLILSKDETRIFNELARGNELFEIRADDADPPFTLAVQNYNIRYSISTPPNGKPSVIVRADASGIVEEADDPLFKQNWGELEESAGQLTAQRYTALLEKLQKHEVDPIGLGLKYIATRHHGKQDWEEWKKLYPEIAFDVKVKVNLESSGLIK